MVSRARNTDWLATVFYPLAVVLMEACWVYPWLIWLGNFPFFSQPRPALSLASVIIVLAAATLSIRLFTRQQWPVSKVQAAVIGLGLVIFLLVLGIEYNGGYVFPSGRWFAYAGKLFGNMFSRPDTIVLALPALVYLWWRGINLGQATSYFRNIYQSFLIGLVALIALNIIWQVTSASGAFPKPGPGIVLDVIIFFFFGLLAIAISHLYMMRNSMPKEEAGRSSVWRWLPIMLVVIGGMSLAVFGVAGIFSPGFFATVGRGFSVFFEFVWKILNYLLIPFNFIFEALIWVLRWLIARLPRGEPLSQNTSDNVSMGGPFAQTTPADLPAVLLLALKWLILAAVIGAVIYILAKAVSRFRARQAAEEIDEIHESLFSWRGLGNDLKELLGQIGKRQKKPAPHFPGYYTGDDKGRLSIREIYRRLLHEADRSGLARGRHETPGEYSVRLGRIVPESREQLDSLTDTYIGVRYGETDAKEKQVDNANSLWRILRSLLRGLRGE